MPENPSAAGRGSEPVSQSASVGVAFRGVLLDVDVHIISEWHDYGPDRASFFREGLDSDSARNLSARSSCIRITASKVSE